MTDTVAPTRPGSTAPSDVATGTAYGMPQGTHDAVLTEVGARTPAGETMRRFWHPVAVSSKVTDLPVRVRVLGEDLVLFRTRRGKVGLVHPRCAHRGSSLAFGKLEDDGIRCAYHGWLFDTEGRTLDQPCEVDGGHKRHTFRQPWYAVQERYGLVFAYLGPPDQQPPLPRYDNLETVPEGLVQIATDHTLLLGGPKLMPANWMQNYENVVDTWHVYVLHSTLTGTQFDKRLTTVPEITWDVSDYGVRAISHRRLEDGTTLTRVSEMILPTAFAVSPPTDVEFGPCTEVMWVLPVDDTTVGVFLVKSVPPQKVAAWLDRTNAKLFDENTKSWFDLDDEGHQRFPGDYEAQASQGPISLHSEEHLTGSDRGIAMYRRMWRKAITAVAQDKQPLNHDVETFTVTAGSYLTPAGSPLPGVASPVP